MDIGIQTISWGLEFDLDEMLKDIADLGYQGIEIAQHPELFGDPFIFSQKLKAKNLKFLGIAGGTLDERVKLSKVLKPNYIYVENWSETEEKKYQVEIKEGLIFALHTHMFKPVQTWEEAKNLLQQFKYLHFLPDLAHLMVAGEDILKVMEEAENLFGWQRIPTIHFKDWIPDYGRSYQFYSQGFVELGKGNAPLDKIVRFLLEKNFSGWIVVEQDSAPISAKRSAKISREWLEKNKLWKYSR